MSAPSPYRVSAYNTAKASENKIHDDATARRFGFSGGLVGGVHVYAYMTHQPLAHWGRAWLERGTGDCKFSKPVYEGDIAEIVADETTAGIDLRVISRGELCATGSARLPASVTPPPIADFQSATPPAHDARPPADEQSLAVGRWLGMNPLDRHRGVSRAGSQRHARDRPAVCGGRDRASRHDPALLQLGIVAQRGAAGVDACRQQGAEPRPRAHRRHAERARPCHAELRAQGPQVRRGRRAGAGNERTPLARVTHTAIYLPRQLAEAA